MGSLVVVVVSPIRDQEEERKDLEHAATEQRSTSFHATTNKQHGDNSKQTKKVNNSSACKKEAWKHIQ